MRGFQEVKEVCKKHKNTPITLPTRADAHSAGYDVYSPEMVVIKPNEVKIIWTDVKAYMQEDEYLALHIRSSMGIKNGIILANCTGVVDSSYYENKANDGNIGIALKNLSNGCYVVKKGDRIAQGIFQKYYTCKNDETSHQERKGGMGSSGR